MKLILCLLCISLIQWASAHYYCTEDSDCNHLGNLKCIKSMCNWGICGCPRGKVSRFLGSTKKFQCVELSKIGESCDTGSGRVCGAINSQCFLGVCVCSDTDLQESRWGGERCFDKHTTYSTETCTDVDALGDSDSGLICEMGTSWWEDYDNAPIVGLPDYPLDGVMNVIACAPGQHTSILNDFVDSSYVGGKAPGCVSTKVGDFCLNDDDCSNIQANNGGVWAPEGGKCEDNTCVCANDDHTVDITGLYCGTALEFGETCAINNEHVASNVGVCDGTIGLRCGDPCDLTMLQIDAVDRNLTCVCDPAYTTSGSTCSPIGVGSDCFGDQNCKAIASDAVCTDGSCREGAVAISCSFATILLTLTLVLKDIFNAKQ